MVAVQGETDLLEVVATLGAEAGESRTFWTAGSSRPIRIAMMAITTSNSIRVKPPREARRGCDPSDTRRAAALADGVLNSSDDSEK